jgi:geranylgeranyl pyrophosphate synthase
MNMTQVSAERALAERDSADRFLSQLDSWRQRMERALDARLPEPGALPDRLHEAIRYSVLGGGKRVRPSLMFATARTLGLDEDAVEGAACAVELVHAYSLVHDDLPAMDDDALRRGRPTCHVAFDEATAILVGDALQPLAFAVLARDPALPDSPSLRLELITLLAGAISSFGMVGGQAIDLGAAAGALDLAGLEDLHARKTGALIRASVLMAATCVRALPAGQYDALERFANCIGLAFQIQDDLLEVVGDAALVGKPVGAERGLTKPTFPGLIGIGGSRERLANLHAEAMAALDVFGTRAEPLRLLSEWLLKRRS